MLRPDEVQPFSDEVKAVMDRIEAGIDDQLKSKKSGRAECKIHSKEWEAANQVALKYEAAGWVVKVRQYDQAPRMNERYLEVIHPSLARPLVAAT